MSNTRGQLKCPIDTFDQIRGDVLSITREDFIELYEYDDNDFLEVLRQLGAFFIGKRNDPEPKIVARDKRNIGVIKRLIAHQKTNAAIQYKKRVSQYEKAKKRWGEKFDGDAVAMPRHTTAYEENATAVDIEPEQDKDKDESMKSLSLVGDDKAPYESGPVTPILVAKAKARKELAILAPPIENNSVMLTNDGNKNAVCSEIERMFGNLNDAPTDASTFVKYKIAEDIFKDVEYSEENNSDNFLDNLDKAAEHIPLKYERTLTRVLVKAWQDIRDGKATNPPGFVIDRVKRLADAVRVIE